MKRELLGLIGCGMLAVSLASCGVGAKGDVVFDYTNTIEEAKAVYGAIDNGESVSNAITRVEEGTAYMYKHASEIAYDFDGLVVTIYHPIVAKYETKKINGTEFAVIKETKFDTYSEYVTLPPLNNPYDSYKRDFEVFENSDFRTYLNYTPKEKFNLTLTTYKVVEDSYEKVGDYTVTVKNLTYEQELDLIERANYLHEHAEDHIERFF